jgi:hypothetical protein
MKTLSLILLTLLCLQVPVHASESDSNDRPVQMAASKFGGFFRNLLKKPAPATNAPAAKPIAVSNFDISKFTKGQLDTAIKEALGNGLTNAINQLGRAGGFLTNQTLRIPMPPRLKKIEAGLRRYGQDTIADSFVKTMNEAAEDAVPLAAPIFNNALRKLTVEDAARILSGPDNSATEYFRKATSSELTALFQKQVSASTAKVGLTSAYKQLLSRLRFGATFLNYDVDDLDQYITGKTLDGLFSVVAEEEQKIRKDPVARTTNLMKSVFGSIFKK